jgi:hypothetical protein
MWITLNVALSNLASHGRNSGNVYTGALWRLVSKRFSGLVDRSRGYDQALLDERVPTRLGDGSVDVEVEGELISPFTGDRIDALSIRASWLRQAEPGSSVLVVGSDANGRTMLSVGGVSFTYGIEGLHRAKG